MASQADRLALNTTPKQRTDIIEGTCDPCRADAIDFDWDLAPIVLEKADLEGHFEKAGRLPLDACEVLIGEQAVAVQLLKALPLLGDVRRYVHRQRERSHLLVEQVQASLRRHGAAETPRTEVERRLGDRS